MAAQNWQNRFVRDALQDFNLAIQWSQDRLHFRSKLSLRVYMLNDIHCPKRPLTFCRPNDFETAPQHVFARWVLKVNLNLSRISAIAALQALSLISSHPNADFQAALPLLFECLCGLLAKLRFLERRHCFPDFASAKAAKMWKRNSLSVEVGLRDVMVTNPGKQIKGTRYGSYRLGRASAQYIIKEIAQAGMKRSETKFTGFRMMQLCAPNRFFCGKCTPAGTIQVEQLNMSEWRSKNIAFVS